MQTESGVNTIHTHTYAHWHTHTYIHVHSAKERKRKIKKWNLESNDCFIRWWVCGSFVSVLIAACIVYPPHCKDWMTVSNDKVKDLDFKRYLSSQLSAKQLYTWKLKLNCRDMRNLMLIGMVRKFILFHWFCIFIFISVSAFPEKDKTNRTILYGGQIEAHKLFFPFLLTYWLKIQLHILTYTCHISTQNAHIKPQRSNIS